MASPARRALTAGHGARFWKPAVFWYGISGVKWGASSLNMLTIRNKRTCFYFFTPSSTLSLVWKCGKREWEQCEIMSQNCRHGEKERAAHPHGSPLARAGMIFFVPRRVEAGRPCCEASPSVRLTRGGISSNGHRLSGTGGRGAPCGRGRRVRPGGDVLIVNRRGARDRDARFPAFPQMASAE